MRRSFAPLVAVILFLGAFPVVCVALEVKSGEGSANDLLPSANLYTPEELGNTFARHQFTPFGDRRFFHEILIPNGWESRLSEVDPGQLTHDTESPVPMTESGPAGADDVGIQVQYMRVPDQSGPGPFIDKYVQMNKATIVARHQIEVKGRRAEDALIKSEADDLGPMLTRVAAFRRGEFIFLVSGWATEEKYEKYKRAFGAVITSFDPSGK